MGVPLLGLNDVATVFEREQSVDNYGNLELIETAIISEFKCRRTNPPGAMQDLLEINQGGGQVEENWLWISDYTPLIREGMLIKRGDEVYKIIKVIPKRNSVGNFHHLKLKTRMLDENG